MDDDSNSDNNWLNNEFIASRLSFFFKHMNDVIIFLKHWSRMNDDASVNRCKKNRLN